MNPYSIKQLNGERRCDICFSGEAEKQKKDEHKRCRWKICWTFFTDAPSLYYGKEKLFMKLYIIDNIRTNNFHGEQMMGQIKIMWENTF